MTDRGRCAAKTSTRGPHFDEARGVDVCFIPE
jgi:hypothetical protein